MKKISIVNTRDQAIEINLPEDPSEVPIRKFIDYSMAYEGFFDWYNELAKAGTLYQNRSLYIYKLCQIISEYFEVDLNSIIRYDISQLLDETGQLRADILSVHAKAMLDQTTDMSQVENLDEVEDTLLTLSLALNQVVIGYKPELPSEVSYKFVYKGETWVLPKANVLDFNMIEYPKFTVYEIVESMEIQRWGDKIRSEEKTKAEKMGTKVNSDTIGSTILTEYLTTFAILCRKEGEEIDIDNFDSVIKRRVHHFIDLDMKTVRDLLFFSQNTLSTYVSDQIANITSTLLGELQETLLSQKP